ncbi:MAG: phosphohydrolase [Pseudolysinimonas sp.]
MADLFSRFRRDRDATASKSADLSRWFSLGLDPETMWSQLRPGPSATEVASRLGSAPSDFLDPQVDISALAGDVLGPTSQDPLLTTVLSLAEGDAACRAGAALALWLAASQDLVEPFDPPIVAGSSATGIAALALRLAPVVPPEQWLVNAEHREEAARLFLLWNGLQPSGEDLATARSRWDRRDSLVRDAALRQMMEDQQHRLDVQRALDDKRAVEAAARYSHE